MVVRVCLVLLAVCSACATAPASRPLPLTKLRLYETGVGYFEREGRLGGPGGASVPVPSSHLDDAIKSLVVLGGNGGVQSVTFESRQSPAVARARAGLPADTEAPIRVHDVLLGLRGHEVVVRHAARRIRGRIVDVIGVPELGAIVDEGEDAPTSAEQAGAAAGKTYLLLVTRGGRYRRVDVARLEGITPVDPEVRARIQGTLDATAALRTNARGLLDVTGTGGSVHVGYLAESPVWRASYRLVQGETDLAVLQGWALVHNDTEDDWHAVALELVNGRPDSFLYPLAAPRYERRELVVPERELSSVPQLLDTTPDALWGDFVSGADMVGLGSYGTVGHGSGSGYGSGRGSVSRGAVTTVTGASDLVAVGNLAALVTGKGRETKTAFVYETGAPLDLVAGRSAMVPFVQADVGSATVTWFSGFSNATARHAVQVTNTTAQTLPEGTLSVFADGGFAGETVLPRLKPGMRRFLEVGDDPDTEMKVDRQTASEAPQRLVFREGALQEHVIRTTELVLDLIHHGNQARHVRVEVFAGSNTTIEGADRVDFDEDRGHPLAAFEIEPGGRIDDRKVVIVEGLARSTRFDAITADQLERLSTAASLPATERSHAKTALERLRVQLESAQTVERVKADITTAEQDIERLRGHLQAMSGEGDGENNPLVKRLLAAEDALEALRRGLEAATAELAARTAATREQLTALQPTLGSPPV